MLFPLSFLVDVGVPSAGWSSDGAVFLRGFLAGVVAAAEVDWVPGSLLAPGG